MTIQKIYKMRILLFCSVLVAYNAIAQKDGIGGYGELQYNFLLSSKYPNQYLLGGGGVVINNNIMVGGYVGSMVNMYTSNTGLDSNQKNLISVNPYSQSTFASISDFGLNLGFNVNSQKDFQILVSMKAGISIVNVKDNVFTKEWIAYAIDTTGNIKTPSSIFTVNNYSAIGFNMMPQVGLQFYIGKSMKLFSNFGYRLVVVNDQYTNPITNTQESIFYNRWMFNSTFINFGVSFGSF